MLALILYLPLPLLALSPPPATRFAGTRPVEPGEGDVVSSGAFPDGAGTRRLTA